MPLRDPIELVTTLGDGVIDMQIAELPVRTTALEAFADGSDVRVRMAGDEPSAEHVLEPGQTLTLPVGLGTVSLRIVPRPRRQLPHGKLDGRALAYLAGAIAAHIAVLAVALPREVERVQRRPGGHRPRLVAAHTTDPRAMRAPDIRPSVHVDDSYTAAPYAVAAKAPTRAARARPSDDDAAAPNRSAAHHPDPCDGDCDVIPTGAYDTHVAARAGDAYQLTPRHRRELVISSETCTVDGGCTTVSGDDQKELRGELGQHVAELRACFLRDDTMTKVAVDLRIEGGRAAAVSTHDENPVSACVSAIVGALGYPGEDRTVTLAFSRD